MNALLKNTLEIHKANYELRQATMRRGDLMQVVPNRTQKAHQWISGNLRKFEESDNTLDLYMSRGFFFDIGYTSTPDMWREFLEITTGKKVVIHVEKCHLERYSFKRLKSPDSELSQCYKVLPIIEGRLEWAVWNRQTR